MELIRISREQLRSYENVEWRCGTVERIIELEHLVQVRFSPLADSPTSTSAPSELLEARVALLACGSIDLLPEVAGFSAIYGQSAHHCSFCDGFEYRNKRIMVYGPYFCLMVCSAHSLCYREGPAGQRSRIGDAPAQSQRISLYRWWCSRRHSPSAPTKDGSARDTVLDFSSLTVRIANVFVGS
jgi:hypothetical protein